MSVLELVELLAAMAVEFVWYGSSVGGTNIRSVPIFEDRGW